jgi:hypothetical protein
MSGRSEIRIADRCLLGLTVETVQQPWIGFELFWSSPELPRVADHYSQTAMHPAQDTSKLYVLIAIAAKVADFASVNGKADYSKAALIVGQVGWADVQETRTVQEFDDIVHMGLYANILSERNRRRLGQVRSRRRRGSNLR